jgi:O-antigen/teichoic acid export membrane protein
MKKTAIEKVMGALGGQSLFLLTNMLSFLVVVKIFSPGEFASWGFYLSLMALLDGIRQGLIQNGLTRYLIQYPKREKPLLSSASVLHLGFIGILSLLLAAFAGPISAFWNLPEMEILLRYSWLTLMASGTLQSVYSLLFAKGKTRTYFFINLYYLIGMGLVLLYLSLTNQIGLLQLLWAQSVIGLLLAGYGGLQVGIFSMARPSLFWIRRLLSFGKHVAGTNAFSLLFQKADLWMIGYFLDAKAVALFLLATKVIQYIDLPLSALSQMIYPRLAATDRSKDTIQLNFELARGILLLFALILPGVLLVLMFSDSIILLLSTGQYLEAAPLIILLSLASLAKPWGRVLGMALDATGKPQINLHMLAISLIINVVGNAILIPIYGVIGAAFATSMSTVLTIVIGQIRIRKYLDILPFNQQTLLIWSILTKHLKLKTA